jgi:acyl dehydratase
VGGVLNWLDPHVEIWPNGAPQVGDIAEMRRTVTATDIERFTEISGDRNPLHYDLEAARASRFGEILLCKAALRARSSMQLSQRNCRVQELSF